VAEDRIYAHAHDLGIQFGEPVAICLVRRRLRRSSRRPVQRVKGQHDMPFPAELRKLEPVFFFAGACGDIEVRSASADLKGCHEPSSLERIWTAPQAMDFTSCPEGGQVTGRADVRGGIPGDSKTPRTGNPDACRVTPVTASLPVPR
jgi:hypothetical protein